MTDFAPSVLLIYTGGTIGMIENPETGALESFNFDHLLNFVPELKRFNYHINTYSFDPPLILPIWNLTIGQDWHEL